MLKLLSIQNIVLIDKAEINFAPGLCVLTGETGSGKSILLDALGLAIGFRSNLRLIGNDENKAQVAAEFDISKNEACKILLSENDLCDAENKNSLRIRRSISENSASKVFINDVAVGVNLLSKIGETLVEIHGQHDQRGLLNSSAHLSILDEFASNAALLKKLKKNYEELRATEEKIAALKAKKEQAEREKDYLEHVVRELENADLKEGEEDELVAKKNALVGKEKILNFLNELKSHLTEANSALITSQRILIRNNNVIDNFLADKKDELENINVKIDEQCAEIDTAISSFESIIREISSSENNLEEIEERLFLIRSLARKFNVQIDELPKIILDAQEKLKLISGEEEMSHELETQRSKLFAEYKELAQEISERRKKSAKILSQKVEEELKSLKMEGTKFLVEVTPIQILKQVQDDDLGVQDDDLGVRDDNLGVRDDNLGVRDDDLGVRDDDLGVRDDDLGVKDDDLGVKDDDLGVRDDGVGTISPHRHPELVSGSITPTGIDKVRFTASINKNSFDDISKIASGGELSRFMLALKVALMDVKSVPTMIFDEIDTGIGGSTADAVGKRLKILSKNLQVLVVTHQPQIASKAETHFKISKTADAKKIKTVIEKLDADQREKEVARMLSGETITSEAISAAKILISSNG